MNEPFAPSLREPAPHDEALRVGVIGALAAASMLFASLVSAYVVRRSFADWREASAVWPFILLTLATCASLGMEMAARAEGPSRRRGWSVLVWSSVAYLVIAIAVLVSITSPPGLPPPHRAFAFLLLGLHVVHAILGGAFAQWVLRTPASVSGEASLSLCRLVTHFLTLLLAAILFILFLLP